MTVEKGDVLRRVLVLALIASFYVLATVSPVLAGNNLRVTLSGAEEVPPVETNSRGLVTINTIEGQYELKVLGLVDVVAAHIHCGAAGTNGPVGVTLFSGGPTSKSGLLASGSIAPDAGNACGWTSIAEVIAAIETGDTYVNVHTLAYPGGQVRGQL